MLCSHVEMVGIRIDVSRHRCVMYIIRCRVRVREVRETVVVLRDIDVSTLHNTVTLVFVTPKSSKTIRRLEKYGVEPFLIYSFQ